MDEKIQKKKRILKWYASPVLITLIFIVVFGIVYICYQKINIQFCEERLRTLDAVSSKITISTHTRFEAQWTSLDYSAKILQALETGSEGDLFVELRTIEDSLGFSEHDGMLYLFDDKGYYYGEQGKIGLWGDQEMLLQEQEHSLYVTNLPKQATHLGDFMMFFYRLPKPMDMDGINVTHVALARDISIFDDDLEIGDYGDVDSSYIIRKNGTRIYHQSNNEVFTNVYNVLKALDGCRFEHGVTMEKIKRDMQFNKAGSAHMFYKGVDYIIAYQPLDISDWYAIYIVSLNSMSQDTREFIFQTVLMISGAGIALLLLCLILIHINNYNWRQKQKMINDQLRDAVEENKRANNAKSDFLSRMSHDIRTPLNGIVGMADVAQKNIKDPEKIKDCLEKIVNCSEHLMWLINDVLDMSRIESGRIEIRSAPFDLGKALRECTYMIEGHTCEHDIAFRYDCSGITHHLVLGDEHHLKQILINILGNAVKFTPNGGSIVFSVTETDTGDADKLYRFEISDTGIGMSADFLEHIFEPFSQEYNGPRTDYSGTGLGMSIVKRLVEQMRGEIQVESQKNKGSCFRVLLPMRTLAEECADDLQKQGALACTEMHGKILLAEDGVINREIAEYLLQDAGMTCVSVEDGQQAVEVFEKSQPGEFDAILMDILMPVLDGLEAARKIRAMDRPDAKTIPILAMTANAYRADEEKSIEAGMNAHLTKPLSPNDVVAALKHFIQKKRETDEEST